MKKDAEEKLTNRMVNIVDTLVKQSVKTFDNYFDLRDMKYVLNAYNTPNEGLENDLDKLTKGGIQFKDDPEDRFIDIGDILFYNSDEDFVVNSLNRQYGQYGFTFQQDSENFADEGIGGTFLPRPIGQLEKDQVIVTHKNMPDRRFIIRFGHSDNDINYNQADLMKIVMRAMYNGDYKVIKDLGTRDFEKRKYKTDSHSTGINFFQKQEQIGKNIGSGNLQDIIRGQFRDD